MAIRKRNRDTSAVVKTSRENVQSRVVSKKITDYSANYMDLLTKGQNSQQIQDPFIEAYNGPGVAITPLEPIYPFNRLISIFTESTVLRQCVEAYKVNVESYGYVLEYSGPPGKQSSKEVLEEKTRLSVFLNTLSAEASLKEIREQSRIDLETLGFRTFEIGRNVAGEITMMNHVQAHTIRVSKRDKEATPVQIKHYDRESGVETVQTVERHFRRYIQRSFLTLQNVYFKEFGDPRKINPHTGQVDNSLSTEDEATELYFESLYVPGHVYGLPRWIGQLPAILGSKEAELVNLNFFKENAIPALAVMISGGALTAQSFNQITDYITALKGQKSMNRILVLEAHSDESSGSTEHSQPAPKITMQPMISERQQDGLFQDYDIQNAAKVRSCFRLPPIYVGRAEDYTRASAVASMQTAEDQIFIPERLSFDDFMNNRILSTYAPRFWRYKSLGVPLSDPDSLSTILKAIGAEGALTPNLVIQIANKILDVDMIPVKEKWGDVPFSVVLAQIKNGNVLEGFDEYVKKVANATANPTTDPAAADKPTKGKAKPKTPEEKLKAEVKNIVRKELRDMVEDVKEELLQTVAR
jgi:PBSX family phage portal protein